MRVDWYGVPRGVLAANDRHEDGVVVPVGSEIAVVGRANVDLTARVPGLPTPGRAVFSAGLVSTPGGKGLNQAIAVARLGGQAMLVANVGVERWGDDLRAALVAAGVDTRGVRQVPGATTGAAIIQVTPDGEPYVTVAVPPETELSGDDVVAAFAGRSPAVVVVQLDLRPDAVQGVLRGSRPEVVIGNLVPHPGLDRRLLALLDVVVMNQAEAAAVLGAEDVEPVAAAQRLRRLGPSAAVVTAAARGAAYSGAEGSGVVPAAVVPVVDASGTGMPCWPLSRWSYHGGSHCRRLWPPGSGRAAGPSDPTARCCPRGDL
jgi:ribokinase